MLKQVTREVVSIEDAKEMAYDGKIIAYQITDNGYNCTFLEEDKNPEISAETSKNWIVFYPVEKLLSRITDVLITINTEDYKRAKKSFKAKETIYVPGVGVNTEKVEAYYRRDEIRKALGKENLLYKIKISDIIESNDRILLSCIIDARKKQASKALVRKGFR